jgi:hypothetical protein
MRNPSPALRQGLLTAFVLIGMVAVLVGLSPRPEALSRVLAVPPATSETPKPETAPLFTWSEPAKNPVRLHLLGDSRRVVGWLSGADFAGQKVRVQAGETTTNVTVDASNTFTWDYAVKAATRVTFILGDLQRTMTVHPAPAAQPAAFFVLDRFAYRPGQTLHFAAFLRQLDARQEWQPIRNREVEVQLVSQKRGTIAGRFKLASDDFGRVTGSYTFIDDDALDRYALGIPGFHGEGQLTLAEYRKPKVRLKITGKVENSRLKLSFTPLDFMDRPVPGSKVHFTARVVRAAAERGTAPLTNKSFALLQPAFRNSSTPPMARDDEDTEPPPQPEAVFNFDGMDDEQRLLYEAGSSMTFTEAAKESTVGQLQGDLAMAGKPSAEYTALLHEDWLHGPHAVIVEGMVVDQYGQEQRATQRITLAPDDRRLTTSIAKEHFTVGEPIRVKVQARGKDGKDRTGSSVLTVMRLQADPSAWFGGWFGNEIPDLDESNVLAEAAQASKADGAFLVSTPQTQVARKLISAVAYKGDTATVKLSRAGAYKLVTVTEFDDGTTLRHETGCVVLPRERFPGVVLKLDRKAYRSGDELIGVIHSRFTGAKVLLTVRDSAGIRLTRPLVLKDRVTELRLPIAAEWGYGLQVDVLYHDAEEQIAAAGEFIHVLPAQRIIDIKTKTKALYGPSESVRLEIQCDRKEPVDLVVSVYDQSLQSVAADRSANIRDFFLADTRGRHATAEDMLHLRLRGLTVRDLLRQARKNTAKATEKTQPGTPPVDLDHIEFEIRDGALSPTSILALLHASGYPMATIPNWYHGLRANSFFCDNTEQMKETLAVDVLRRQFPQPRYHPFTNRLEFGSPAPRVGGMLGMGMQMGMAGNFGMGGGMFGFRQGMFGGQMMGIPPADPNEGYGNPGGPVGMNMGMSILPNAGGQGALSIRGHASADLIGADADQSGLFVRRDFSDTAFWNANVRTDAEGKALVEFKLPDSLTNWQVVVHAVSAKMHVGRQVHHFQSSKPIMVWPMLPKVFTAGDKVEFFGSLHNLSDEKQTMRARLKVENGEVLSPVEQVVEVPAHGNRSVYWTFAAREAGFTQILMTAECAAGSDASLKRLPVIEAGVEQIITRAGFCKGDVQIDLPDGIDPSRATLEVTLTPSLAADMADTLDYLVEYPYGCVEQTMSRFLPAIKVAQTLKRAGIKHPKLEQRLPSCVAGGIKRLLELQNEDGSWGWHGGGAAHEMMTPYALFGLLEAERAGYTIPRQNAIDRGLKRLLELISAGDRTQHLTDDIFGIYVYARRNRVEQRWWDFIRRKASEDQLSDYALALSLELAVEHKQADLADLLAFRLRDRAKDEGGKVWWTTAKFSNWGDDRYEITAAVLKALTAYDINDKRIAGALSFFAATKRGNRWNSTKDTAMILFALCDYLAKRQIDVRARAEASVRLNNEPEAHKATFENGLVHKVVIPGSELKAKNRLSLRGSEGTLYRAVLRYKETGRDLTAENQGLEVYRSVFLLNDKGQRVRELQSGERIPRGSYLECEVRVSRVRQGMSYVLVVNPKPTGAEAVPTTDTRFNREVPFQWALREDRAAGIISHHEQTPETFTDGAIFLAELAGEFVLAPATAELMYETEIRGHSGTFVLNVKEGK